MEFGGGDLRQILTTLQVKLATKNFTLFFEVRDDWMNG